jgi:hypothetical protein
VAKVGVSRERKRSRSSGRASEPVGAGLCLSARLLLEQTLVALATGWLVMTAAVCQVGLGYASHSFRPRK